MKLGLSKGKVGVASRMEGGALNYFALGTTGSVTSDIPFSAEGFKKIITELGDLHYRKNHDYAGDQYLQNLTASRRMGLPAWKGTLIRLQDKISRLENFAIQDELKVKDESVEDTLKDLAVYSILCLILYKNKK